MSLTGCDLVESISVRPAVVFTKTDEVWAGLAPQLQAIKATQIDCKLLFIDGSYKERLLEESWKDKSGSLEAQYNCVRVSMPVLYAINTVSEPIEGMPERRSGLHVCLCVRVHICACVLVFLAHTHTHTHTHTLFSSSQ